MAAAPGVLGDLTTGWSSANAARLRTVGLERKHAVEQLEIGEQLDSPAQPVPKQSAARQLVAAPVSELPDPAPFVLALGQVEPRFPSLAVEREFAQAIGQTTTAGQTDRQAMQTILADRANRYLARQICWVFTIEGLETYLLTPRDPVDLELLIDSIRPNARATDKNVVIGVRGPIAPAEACNGLTVPIVVFDQLYSFDRDELIGAIPRPEKLSKDKEEQFQATANELFDRIMQMSDNAGATDEHRAVNYLAIRYPAIYARA
ncbi:MAG: hypothetical protein ACRDQZ_12715, partial [Mycobacteriales bacterium]